jgi:polyisoprenoid-binding protein YceI
MRRRRLGSAAALASGGLWLGAAAPAAGQTLILDPARSTVGFALGATLHSVAGGLRLLEGAIRFDPDGGAASGEIALDAASASTGLALRDRTLHREVLESERHPRIVFRAERLRVLRRDATSAEVELEGRLDLHGQERPLVIPARLAASGGRIAIEARFRVAYVDWGMRDPSTFLLRVDRFVDVTVHSEGRVDPP